MNRALLNFHSQGKPVVPGAITALENESLLVRICTASLLGKIGPDARSAIPALKKRLKDDDETVRERAQEAIHKIEAPAAPSTKGQ